MINIYIFTVLLVKTNFKLQRFKTKELRVKMVASSNSEANVMDVLVAGIRDLKDKGEHVLVVSPSIFPY